MTLGIEGKSNNFPYFSNRLLHFLFYNVIVYDHIKSANVKAPYSLITIATLILCLCACKKDGSNLQASIVGKWHENKLVIEQQNLSTGAVLNATYTGKAFDTTDYFQFNADNTAVTSYSGSFSVSGKTTFKDGSGNPISGKGYYRSFKVEGSLLILQIGFIPECLNCTQPGPTAETIVQLDANNLVLHAVPDTSSTYNVTTDTFYTKGQ
jgi:hypothetical protein